MKVLFISRQPNLFEKFALPDFEISEDYKIIDQVLEDKELVRELAKDFPDTDLGAERTPIEQTLRFLVLRHQKNLSYRDLERTLKTNLEDRWFCKIVDKVPTFKTIQNQFILIKEETLKKINQRIIDEARKRKLTKGKRLRVDSTVVESNIHYPTDSSLIVDGIRVINRIVKKLKVIPKSYRSFKVKLKQQINIIRSLGRKSKEVRDKAVREIVKMGKVVVDKSNRLKNDAIQEMRGLLKKVIDQTELVLAKEKPKDRIVSVFEPTARPIVKGKAGKPCEFGHRLQVMEDEHFITEWKIDNQTTDVEYLKEALDKHGEIFDKPPKDIATDRGYYSKENVDCAKEKGVKNISIPKRGKLDQGEKDFQSTRKFKQLQCWRAGGEAKISWLKRRFGLSRCLSRGDCNRDVWIGGGIIACNLVKFAKLSV